MNDHDKLIEEIQGDETWLTHCATPAPDKQVIERIKFVVRAACGECHGEAPEARSAMAKAKTAVRRELLTNRPARRTAWRLVAPTLAAAAAVAFGVFRLAVDTQPASAMDPTFAVFVETMGRSQSALDLSLSELDQDVAAWGDDGFAMSHTDWSTDWIDGVGENLDTLSDELEQM